MAGRDLLAPEGKDLLAAETKAPAEPTFGEKAGAFAYGLGTSTLGALGEFESFVVPEQLKRGGFAEKTYLPSTKDIQKGYEMIGIPKPREAVRGYQTAGEFAPAVAAGGKAIYELGKFGVGKLGKMLGGGKDLAEELRRTTAGRVAEETERAGKKAETAESRAAAAQRITEREAGKPEQVYGQMPGVKLGTEAGVTKPIPQTMDEIGTTIRAEADKVYDQLKATREANAQKLKADAFESALAKERAGQKIEDTKAFDEAKKKINAEIVNPETKLTVASVDSIKNQLLQVKRAMSPREVDPVTGIVRGKPVSFEGLENLRRFLRDRASGLPAEGFDAISQQQAGRLAKIVEDVMSDFSDGKIKKFIEQYRKDSEPMRVFQSKVGKALVDEQLVGKGVNYAQVPAQSIPGKVFKTREDYKALVDGLGGNEALARQAGQRYFASQLEGIKDAKGAEKFIRDNRTMLRETDFLRSAEQYAINLRRAETRGARAGEMQKGRAATATEQRALEGELQRIGSDVQRARNLEEINAQAAKVTETLYKAGRMTLDQRDQVLRSINEIKNLEDRRKTIMNVIKIGLPSGVGGTLAYEYFVK